MIDHNDVKTYFGPTVSDILDVIITLQNAGLDLNEPIDVEGDTLLVKSASRSVDLVRFFLQHGADIDRANNHGETPLFFATTFGPFDVVQHLVDAGAQVRMQNADGDTPLHHAVTRCDEQIVSLLIDQGTDVNVSNIKGQARTNGGSISYNSQPTM